MFEAGASRRNLSNAEPRFAAHSLAALDWLNFFKADAQTTVGPYLAIFLLSVRHWDPGRIGIVMSVPGIVAIVAQTPAGAMVDWISHKRFLVAIAALALALGSLILVSTTQAAAILVAQAIVAAASIILAPAIASISLGIVAPRGFSNRMGRNEAYSHAGAVVAALAAAAVAYRFSTAAIFYFAAVMSVAAACSAVSIREGDIDPALAREAAQANGDLAVVSLRELMRDRRIAIFLFSVVLFHLANAAMLPLVGEMLSRGHMLFAAPYMSACIIVSQLVMLPIAVAAGRESDARGRKAIFLIGFASLPIRGLLFALIRNPSVLIATQILDGVGAGIFGVVSVIVISDLARQTGRFNLLQGAMSTCVAIGAALSNLIAGFVAANASYRTSFMFLVAVAIVGFLFFAVAMPETRSDDSLAHG